jgi:hypothetical protein
MKTFEDFYPFILPEVLGCPEPVVDQALISTLIDFCDKTLVHQVDHDPITVVRGVIDYELDPPVNQTLVSKIMKVFYKDTPLEAVAPDDVRVAQIYNKYFEDVQPQEGPPRAYIQKDPRTISIFPYPQETERLALTLRVALKPTRSATQFDDILFEEYAETIGAGAISRLAMQPGKTYSDMKLAGVKNVLYTAGVNVARQRASRGSTRASTHVRMRKI